MITKKKALKLASDWEEDGGRDALHPEEAHHMRAMYELAMSLAEDFDLGGVAALDVKVGNALVALARLAPRNRQ